jgi:peptide chain release factor 2
MAEFSELRDRAASLKTRIGEMYGYLGIAVKRVELEELEAKAAEPDFWNDANKAREAIDETNLLKGVVVPYTNLVQMAEEVEMMLELSEMEEGDDQQAALDDAEASLEEMDKEFRALEMQMLLGNPLDSKNAFVSIHAGAGGTESCDWADMLYRMYTRYAERHGFKVSVLDYLAGEEAGVKSVTFQVAGAYAYGYLKGERGVHRLVRISPFDSASRRHTSFVALDVTPEFDDDIEVEICESDLRIDTFRASGAGGQHVNTTDSAIRMVHLPTGIVVQCQNERSQHKNRATAMKMLKAKIYEMEQEKKRKDVEQLYGNKGEIAWGHQIRSYVMQPYTMVKDHRTGIDVGNVNAVMDGAIDVFIEAYLKQKQQEED